MTQRELAQRAGVTPETINRIERAEELRSTSVNRKVDELAAPGLPQELERVLGQPKHCVHPWV
jgi:transcriptional regulator with XRE-family HTH domain